MLWISMFRRFVLQIWASHIYRLNNKRMREKGTFHVLVYNFMLLLFVCDLSAAYSAPQRTKPHPTLTPTCLSQILLFISSFVFSYSSICVTQINAFVKVTHKCYGSQINCLVLYHLRPAPIVCTRKEEKKISLITTIPWLRANFSAQNKCLRWNWR